jgi:hypothetical protein
LQLIDLIRNRIPFSPLAGDRAGSASHPQHEFGCGFDSEVRSLFSFGQYLHVLFLHHCRPPEVKIRSDKQKRERGIFSMLSMRNKDKPKVRSMSNAPAIVH